MKKAVIFVFVCSAFIGSFGIVYLTNSYLCIRFNMLLKDCVNCDLVNPSVSEMFSEICVRECGVYPMSQYYIIREGALVGFVDRYGEVILMEDEDQFDYVVVKNSIVYSILIVTYVLLIMSSVYLIRDRGRLRAG